MRCAAFSATARGAEQALRLRAGLADAVDIYLREGRGEIEGARYYARMDDAVAEAFARYDALIFIAAAGIAVRMIAPHVRSKLTDPAVLVVDEGARHVVSLLSGHVGGSNALTHRVADCLGARAVITTATDVTGALAPDALAQELGLRPVPKPMIQTMNGALLEGREIRYAADTRQRRREFWKRALSERGLACGEMSADEAAASDGLTVFITDDDSLRGERLLCLVPRRLAAGIGCRRGVPAEALRAALGEACGRIGQDISAVSMLASAEIKKDEAGLLALASELGIEARFFGSDALRETIEAYGLEESPFVRERVGAGNVCEAAALCCLPHGRFALKKTRFTKVTVALLWEK